MRRLILGGVKSGKSRYAEQQAEKALDNKRCEVINLVATAQALDDEMQSRIERHQQDRPQHWRVTEEAIALASVLNANSSQHNLLVIDCLTLWMTNLLMLDDESILDRELERFIEALDKYQGDLILVSNETNMGIMPLGDLTRRYCDLAGKLHQRLAVICDQVELVVAGLPLVLKPYQGSSESVR